MKYGYARVSTLDQKLDTQIKQLKDAGAEMIVQEKTTGVTKNRPELQELLARLEVGDTLIVTNLITSESLAISQLAKELNISRQKIYRFIDKQENTDVHQYIYINSNKIKMINAEGVRYIKENINRTANGQRVDSERTTTKSIEDNASELFGEDKEKIRTEDGQVSDSGRTTFFIKQIEQKGVQIQLLQQIIEKNQNLLD